eukprot:TRINITY_DN6129_c0_g1_i1.p1 TRINITY_DN6129_c0_g1~~TRINITY_DN6129_c0_g1_i1.p1  ORF type:complete len:114 (+),score=18.02 TRINITY_DN6129_c0_g1_i1:46-342(+)
MAALDEFVTKKVCIITNDGRVMVGTLRGFDTTVNVILEDTVERVFSASEGVESVALGLYIIRGDNVAIVGLVDEVVDADTDLEEIHAPPLRPLLQQII